MTVLVPILSPFQQWEIAKGQGFKPEVYWNTGKAGRKEEVIYNTNIQGNKI